MHTRTLGRSGISISALGLGCWAIGGPTWRDGQPCGWSGADDEESLRALRRGLDLGVNFLDTADVYGCGHSERLIGRLLREVPRERVVLASKFGYPIDEATRSTAGERCDPAYIRAACEASLRRLGTDHLDLYQFHLGGSDRGEDVLPVLEELAEAGKIRTYGWSTDDPERARQFAQGPHCTAIQQRLNVFGGNRETLRVCEEHRLASINRGPLAMGVLTGKFRPGAVFPVDDIRSRWDPEHGPQRGEMESMDRLREILTEDGRTPAQGALGWLWALSPATIPIPGFKHTTQVEENAGAAGCAPLRPDQMARIEALLRPDS